MVDRFSLLLANLRLLPTSTHNHDRIAIASYLRLQLSDSRLGSPLSNSLEQHLKLPITTTVQIVCVILCADKSSPHVIFNAAEPHVHVYDQIVQETEMNDLIRLTCPRIDRIDYTQINHHD